MVSVTPRLQLLANKVHYQFRVLEEVFNSGNEENRKRSAKNRTKKTADALQNPAP